MENSKWMIYKINNIALNMSFCRACNANRFIKGNINILLFNCNGLTIYAYVITRFSLTTKLRNNTINCYPTFCNPFIGPTS